MTNQQALDILTRHNAWRRDNETEFPELPDSPALIGEAIDAGVKAIRDLEKAKKLLHRAARLSGKNIAQEISNFLAKLE